MSEADHYSQHYWNVLSCIERGLVDPKKIAVTFPMDHNEPQPGLYRDSGPYGATPYRYYRADGALYCELLDGAIVDPLRATEKWAYVGYRPVSHEQWTFRAERGHWHDEDPAARPPQVMRPRAGMHAIAEGRGIGDNQPDKAEEIRDQIESLKNSVASYARITSDEQCTQAQTLRARLLEVSGEADKYREKLGRPHYDLYKAVNDKWQPMVKEAKAAADTVRAAMTAWVNEKARKEREAREAAERAAAEHRRRAEEAARAAAEAGKPVEVPAPPPPAPAPAATVSPLIKGAYGRAAKVSGIRVAVIEDVRLVFEHFRNDVEVNALLRKRAQQSVDAGMIVPGVRVEEQAKVV